MTKHPLSHHWIVLIFAILFCAVARGEYYSFDVPPGVDIVSQQVRWPVWAESTYNAIWTNDILGPGNTKVYFYGGVPEADPRHPDEHPANIIWSFWPVSHPINPGETVRVSWGNPRMYAPLAVGEGASGKASGQWPIIKTKQWYQFVLRVWQPMENPAGHSFASQWLHDPNDGAWYHVATMEVPFKAVGTSGLSGFIEDFSHGNRNPRRTEFRQAYYHVPGGEWKAARNFTPSVRQHHERGTVDLIEDGTAAFFETCSGEDYKGNLDYDAGVPKKTVTLNQPESPTFSQPKLEGVQAQQAGKQALVTWSIPATAAPQFAWKIEAMTSDGQVVAQAIDPNARQAIIDGSSITKVRLTITDVFNATTASDWITTKPAKLNPVAETSRGTVAGLEFTCVESADALSALPDFNSLKSVFTGTVDGIDMTVRRQRTKYAIRYSGLLKVPTSGLYAFRLNSYDGSRLLIDKTTVVDNDGIHSYTDKSGAIGLTAGLHTLEIGYFRDADRGENCTYADRLNLDWQGPGIAMQPVPMSAYQRLSDAAKPTVEMIAPKGVVSNVGVKLDAKVNSAIGISRVAYYVDDILWASQETQPWAATVILPQGTFNVHARVFTANRSAFDSPMVRVQTQQAATAPWKVVQIGTPPPRRPLGAEVASPDSVYMVGDGNGIAYQEVTGNVQITAHVAQRPDDNKGTQDDGTHPHGDWAGGILFRPDLTAHDTFLGDKFVAAYARADASTHLQCQKDHNGGGPVAGPDLGHFDWIRLTRDGSAFTASFSEDGKAWKEAGTRTNDLPAKLFVGVFIYSTPGYNPDINGWRFDHVTIKAGE